MEQTFNSQVGPMHTSLHLAYCCLQQFCYNKMLYVEIVQLKGEISQLFIISSTYFLFYWHAKIIHCGSLKGVAVCKSGREWECQGFFVRQFSIDLLKIPDTQRL